MPEMYISPKVIVADFLRRRLDDPNSNRNEGNTSDTFTANSSQTEFTLTPTSGKTVSAVTSVTVDGDSQTKWRDYYIDVDGYKVIFFSGLSGGETVVVNFKEAETQWISPSKSQEKPADSSFYPRVNVALVSSPGTRLGNRDAPVQYNQRFQVDIWTKNKETHTIGSKTYSGEELAEYIGYQITKAFENHEADIDPELYDWVPTAAAPGDLPFDDELQTHHKVVEFILKGLNIGKVDE